MIPLLSLILLVVAKKSITCPVINCDTTFGLHQCYTHSGDMPVETINTFFCPDDRVCDLEADKFSWVTSKLQDIPLKEQSITTSQIYSKYTDKSCKIIEDMIANLEAGRSCYDNRLCTSGICNNQTNICESGKKGFSCNSKSQCDLELGCIASKEWPYQSICQPLGGEGVECLDDKECKLDHYCWYPTTQDAKSKQKKCM